MSEFLGSDRGFGREYEKESRFVQASEVETCYVCGQRADRLALYLGQELEHTQYWVLRALCRGCFHRELSARQILPVARLRR